MKGFDDLAFDLSRVPFGHMDWFDRVTRALEALAAERAADREVKAGRAYYVAAGALSPEDVARWKASSQWEVGMQRADEPMAIRPLPPFVREPRSISHWGMFA